MVSAESMTVLESSVRHDRHGMDADITQIGENKNISFEDQQQTFGKILTSQVKSMSNGPRAPSRDPSRNSWPNLTS